MGEGQKKDMLGNVHVGHKNASADETCFNPQGKAEMKGFCLQLLRFYFLFCINLIHCRVIRKRSDVRIVTPSSQVPALPPGWKAGCYHDGTWYHLDSEVSKTDGDGWCSGLYCDSTGKLIAWDSLICGETTPRPTAIPTTWPGRCNYFGKWYLPGEISSGTDGQGWCYGAYCDTDGSVILWDNFNCHPTTETTTPPTTPPSGCEYGGKWYAPGSEISSGTDGQGWCYGTYCDDHDNIVPWDNFNCHPTTEITMPPTTPPTTFPNPTTPMGCEYEGKWYAPGSEISSGTDGQGWCYGTSCDGHGNIVPWDNFNCHPTTETTTPPTTLTSGCQYEGKWYAPGSEISSGTDGRGWCYGLICETDGSVMPWDDFNCQPTEETTTPLATTAAATTTPEPMTSATLVRTSPVIQATVADSTQKGCFSDGKWYPLNSQISLTKTKTLCFGFLCNDQGKIVPKVCSKCEDSLANCS